MKIEAVFGGILALIVLAVAAYALLSADRGGARAPSVSNGQTTSIAAVAAGSDEDAQLCKCYEGGFDLAGSDVGVMSAQYRTGFEYCRSALGVRGGDAWTAGWNARLSAKPFEASCRTWLRRGA